MNFCEPAWPQVVVPKEEHPSPPICCLLWWGCRWFYADCHHT